MGSQLDMISMEIGLVLTRKTILKNNSLYHSLDRPADYTSRRDTWHRSSELLLRLWRGNMPKLHGRGERWKMRWRRGMHKISEWKNKLCPMESVNSVEWDQPEQSLIKSQSIIFKIWWMCIPPCYCRFTNGYLFYDFLHASLDDNPFPKRIISLRQEFALSFKYPLNREAKWKW